MRLLLLLIVLGVVGYFVWRTLNRTKTGAPQKGTLPDITDGDGNFSLEVIGEYHNQEASAYQDRTDQVRFAMLVLTPQSNNQFDENAVAVIYRNAIIGHLSRNDALAYRKQYGQQITQCRGIIQGGNIKDSVWLDCRVGSGATTVSAAFHSASVANTFPIHVQGEKEHLNHLLTLMGGKTGCIVDATIVMKDGKAAVMVHNSAIGYLNKAQSEWFFGMYQNQAVNSLAFIKATHAGYVARLQANYKLKDLVGMEGA